MNYRHSVSDLFIKDIPIDIVRGHMLMFGQLVNTKDMFPLKDIAQHTVQRIQHKPNSDPKQTLGGRNKINDW